MMKNNAHPSMDKWLAEAKQHPNASKVGMYLFHNGVVRETPKDTVYFDAAENNQPVTGMTFSYNAAILDELINETYALPGIYFVRTWLNSGQLSVGEDLMLVLIGGDTRSHVIDALQHLVGRLKNECVQEIECY